MLSYIHRRLISRHHRIDYFLFALWGLVPVFMAWMLNAHLDQTVTPPTGDTRDVVFSGLWSRNNWLHYWFTLPFSLFLLKGSTNKLFPLDGETENSSTIPLINLFPSGERLRAKEQFRALGEDPKTFVTVLIVLVVIHILDLWELAGNYLTAALVGPECYARPEPDWTVFFLCGLGDITLVENLALVVIAYSCQFLIGLLALLIFANFLRHNLRYIKSIYLRCRRKNNPERPLIVLNFDDINRCFGLKPLSKTFNMQVMILSIAGAIILLSRYANIEPEKTTKLYSIFAAPLGENKALDYLDLVLAWNPINDIGQAILIVAWLACSFIVSIPIAVKFLPLISEEAREGGIDLGSYLKEFLPPDSLDGRMPDYEQLAGKFARNSFWPSGDFRAFVVYFVAVVVLFLIWTPFPLFGRWQDSGGIREEFAFLMFVLPASLGIVSVIFSVLKFSLAYVGTALVKWKRPWED